MSRPPRRVTAADVAARAGCSTAAVSLWLNGKADGRLSPEWRERIAAAVRELGYVPNRAARSLSLGSDTRSLVFLFPGARFSFFGDIVDGVTSVLGPEWEVLFVDSRADGPERRVSVLERVRALAPSGLIVVGPSPEMVEGLAGIDVPTVVIDVESPGLGAEVSRVDIDFSDALSALVDDLRVHGLNRAAYVAYDTPSVSVRARRPMLADALRAGGVETLDEVDDLHVADTDREYVADAFVRRWPTWRDAGVDVIVCGDERLAYGVVGGARRAGIVIPDDVALVSFHDLDPAAIIEPALSSLRVSGRLLGSQAGHALLERLETRRPARRIVVADYVPRASTAARAAAR